MGSSDLNSTFIWLLARVHSLCVSSSGTNVGTTHFVGPERISVDPSLLANACGLAAEGKHTWSGQTVEGVLNQGLRAAGRDWAVHGRSCGGPTTFDPVKDKRRMGI